MAEVSIVSCPSYDPAVCRRALEEAVAPLGGFSFVTPGTRVVIKANLVSAMKPERAATTHPALLCALTELLRERGAEVVIGDSPGGLYTAPYLEAVYRATGLTAAEAVGARLNRDFSQAVASFPEARAARSFQYTRYLDDADVIIDFCKLKTHGMMGMSAAAKNLFGVIPGTMKPEYHFRYPDPRDFARMIVDLNEYFRPRLCLVDAVVGMDGNGPTAGDARPIGALIAGLSPHKTDLVCAELIGLPRSEIPTLEAALERGLIPESVRELDVAGSIDEFRPKEFHHVGVHNSHLFRGSGSGALGLLRSRAIGRLLETRPDVRRAQCVGCRKCESVCPAHAISMKNGIPSIDREKCIRCFCCQEFCPKGAMRVHRTAIAKLLNR